MILKFSQKDRTIIEARKDFESLIKTLKYDSDPESRAKAAEALGKMGNKRAVEPLIQALQDKESYVRLRAVLALGAMKDKTAIEPIIQALQEDEDINVQGGAAWVLGEIGDANVTEHLIKALKNKSSQVRLFAVMALGMVGDHRAVNPLLKSMKDKDNNVRQAAWEALQWVVDRIDIDED